MGGDGWDSPALTQIAGAAMEGDFFTNHFSTEDQSPIIQDFIREFKKRFNRDPDSMAALGYDAAKVLLDAMTRANSTESAKVRDALAATKDFQGVTGKITIDENRNANKSVVVLTVKDNGFHYVETIAP
jgi:branched-chain amino acid transport system substrate-binding protein